MTTSSPFSTSLTIIRFHLLIMQGTEEAGSPSNSKTLQVTGMDWF